MEAKYKTYDYLYMRFFANREKGRNIGNIVCGTSEDKKHQ